NDKPWHDRYYDPLWAACQELNVPVGFHETTGSRMKAAGTDRFQALGMAHISTHPMEQMLACMDIIMGGVMERFPKLRCAFLEAQCGLATLLARPHGRALRMARALWRDDASHGEAVGIFPPARLLRLRMRRGIRRACRGGGGRRQHRHDDRLLARRFEIPQGDGPLLRAASERQEQAEDPVGQRRPPLRAVGCFLGPHEQLASFETRPSYAVTLLRMTSFLHGITRNPSS